MLMLENVTTGYGKKQVLTDITFLVNRGETVLISGGNGSGKSTVLKTIYGILKPWHCSTEGKIYFEDQDITALSTSSLLRHGIAYMPQKKNVFENFTVDENLSVSADMYIKKERKERKEKVYDSLPMLRYIRKRTPFNLSGGEKQILAFGIALIHLPKLFLLDEPFAGVDKENSEKLLQCITELKKQIITFVIVEHKGKLLEHIISKEIKLELGGIKSE